MIRVSYDFTAQKYQLAIVSGATESVIDLDEDEAHQLVTDLIRTGVTLSSDKELALQYKLEATERHLQDMRRLVLLENANGDV